MNKKETDRNAEYVHDEWNALADLLANMIEKYAADLDIPNLPAPPNSAEMTGDD